MLGEQIKKLRIAHGLSQVDLARKLNVSKQSISNWENNNIMPSIDMLKKICQHFSCSADYVLEMTTDEHILLETNSLTLEQATHIKHLVEDMSALNKQMGISKEKAKGIHRTLTTR